VCPTRPASRFVSSPLLLPADIAFGLSSIQHAGELFSPSRLRAPQPRLPRLKLFSSKTFAGFRNDPTVQQGRGVPSSPLSFFATVRFLFLVESHGCVLFPPMTTKPPSAALVVLGRISRLVHVAATHPHTTIPPIHHYGLFTNFGGQPVPTKARSFFSFPSSPKIPLNPF